MPRQVNINELKNKIGEEVVQKLYDEFAGMMIYIPKKGIDMTQEEKEQYIFNCSYDSNVPIPKIAEMVGLSEDRIRKILDKKREEWIEKHRKVLKENNEN